jgi:hypothetical protein
MQLKEDFKEKLQAFCNFLIFFYYYEITGLQRGYSCCLALLHKQNSLIRLYLKKCNTVIRQAEGFIYQGYSNYFNM